MWAYLLCLIPAAWLFNRKRRHYQAAQTAPAGRPPIVIIMGTDLAAAAINGIVDGEA